MRDILLVQKTMQEINMEDRLKKLSTRMNIADLLNITLPKPDQLLRIYDYEIIWTSDEELTTTPFAEKI